MFRAARRRRRATLAAAVGTLSLALAGCGISHPASSAPAPTPAAESAANGSAHAMFKEMTGALRKVRSVSIDFSVAGNRGGTTRILTELELPGKVEATVLYRGQVVNERWLGRDVYFRYNYAALADLTGDTEVAELLHDRWIELPDGSDPLASSMEHMATAKMLQMCDIFGPTGRLTVGPATTVAGLSAVTLKDHGGKPGTAKRTITLSANPPYLPLRIVQTTEGRPGGPALHDCLSDKTARTLMRRAQKVASRFNKRHHLRLKRAVESITRYDQPLHLTKPEHALAPKGSVQSTSNSVSM